MKMKTLPSVLQEKKAEKTAKLAFAVSALFHVGVLLLIGGVVLIPAVMRKDAFMAYKEAVQTSSMEEPPMEVPVEDLPTVDAPAENVEPASGGNSEAQVDVVVVDSSRMTSPFVNTGNVSLDVTALNFSKKGQGNQQGTGVGNAKGGGGGVMRGVGKMTLFGSTAPDASGGMVGTFYDLKQTRRREALNDMLSPENYFKAIRQFTDSGWDANVLRQYWSAPNNLYFKQIYVFGVRAEEAPKAFDVNVEPRAWVIHYKGEIAPPKTGSYRFYGIADDLLVVRVNNAVVLDGSLGVAEKNPRLFQKASSWPESGNVESILVNGERLVTGDWISMDRGKRYPIEILLGERPGGGFRGILLVEKKGEEYKGNRFDLFTTESKADAHPPVDRVPYAKGMFFNVAEKK